MSQPLEMIPMPGHMLAQIFENGEKVDMPLLKIPHHVPLVPSNNDLSGIEEINTTEELTQAEELVSLPIKMLPVPDHMMAPMFENVAEVDMPLLELPPQVSQDLNNNGTEEILSNTADFVDRKERSSTPSPLSIAIQSQQFRDMLCYGDIHDPDDFLQTFQRVGLFSNLAFDKVLGAQLRPTFCVVSRGGAFRMPPPSAHSDICVFNQHIAL